MDTLTKLQTIRDFKEWAADHKIDPSPLALLEYLDQAENCRTCKWQYAPIERVNCHNCRAYSLWERAK